MPLHFSANFLEQTELNFYKLKLTWTLGKEFILKAMEAIEWKEM